MFGQHQNFNSEFDLHDLFCRFYESLWHVKYWLHYMDMETLLLRLLRATKTSDYDLYLECLQQSCPFLFTTDHNSYADYLSVYLIILLKFPHSHLGAEEIIRNNGRSVSSSLKPAPRTTVDNIIEQTINRHAKPHCGSLLLTRVCLPTTDGV